MGGSFMVVGGFGTFGEEGTAGFSGKGLGVEE